MVPVREVMESSRLTRGMKEEFVVILTDIAELLRFSKGENVIREDGRDRDLYLLVDGKVSINLFVPGTLDRMESIVTLRSGQLFGEFALIDAAPRSASVRADTDIAVYKFTAEKLIQACENDYEFGYRLMQNLAAILASRIRDTTLLVRNNIVW